MKYKRFISIVLTLALALSGILSVMYANAEEFSIKGDINCDGRFDIADVVLLQKWLLGVPDTYIENWKVCDLCKDDRIDVFDLTLMRKALLDPSQRVQISSPACRAAALVCADDKELLYYDNINERIAPASLTKLLTASVALRYLSPDIIITVGSEQSLVKPGSSLCLIRPGHRLKLYDLLTGMLMASGNDAAYTVAAATARAVKPNVSMTDSQAVAFFAELMNEYALSIGMKSSHFVNPEGWDDEEQYTTVSDLLILADHAFMIPEIRIITSQYQKKVVFASGENAVWTNSNSLLDTDSEYYCPYAVGMKTGTTANAGNCLIAAFERGGKTYISVVVGCNTNADRYELTMKIISSYAEQADKVYIQYAPETTTALMNRSAIFERLSKPVTNVFFIFQQFRNFFKKYRKLRKSIA